MIFKKQRIAESARRSTPLQHKLLLEKLKDVPDGEDVSGITVTEHEWKLAIEGWISLLDPAQKEKRPLLSLPGKKSK